MRKRAFIAITLSVCLGAAPSAYSAPGDGCKNKACKIQVKRQIHDKWRAVVKPHQAWIDRTTNCEVNSTAHRRQVAQTGTTGNGFWFWGQFTPQTWRKVGGGRRVPGGKPLGLWSRLPSRLENAYRMVRVLKVQGRNAWPTCG